MRWVVTLLLAVAVCEGRTNVPASLSFTDVSGVIYTSAPNDIIELPVGSNYWNTSTALLTNAIVIRGAGTNETIITRASGYSFEYRAGGTVGPTISNLQHAMTAYTASADNGFILFSTGATNAWTFRISGCYLKFGGRVIKILRRAYGLIDNNTFANVDTSIFVAMTAAGDDDSGSTEWDLGVSHSLGNTNTVVMEDNLFYFDTVSNGSLDEVVYGQNGGKVCFRYNTVNATNHTDTGVDWWGFDGHGDQTPGGSGRSVILYEFYGNVIMVHHAGRFCNWRGGTFLSWSNTFTEIDDSSTPVFVYRDEWWASYATPSTLDHVTNSFTWGNTYNGNDANTPVIASGSEPYVIVNRNYWVSAPNATNGVPVGVFQNYTPLIYPHPLRGALAAAISYRSKGRASRTAGVIP